MNRVAHFLFTCRCKKLSTARKQMSVYRAPNVLVIQMKVRLENYSQRKFRTCSMFLYVSSGIGLIYISYVCLWYIPSRTTSGYNTIYFCLQRFENFLGGKIDRHVLFEERLCLAGYMCRAGKVCQFFSIIVSCCSSAWM